MPNAVPARPLYEPEEPARQPVQPSEQRAGPLLTADQQKTAVRITRRILENAADNPVEAIQSLLNAIRFPLHSALIRSLQITPIGNNSGILISAPALVAGQSLPLIRIELDSDATNGIRIRFPMQNRGMGGAQIGPLMQMGGPNVIPGVPAMPGPGLDPIPFPPDPHDVPPPPVAPPSPRRAL